MKTILITLLALLSLNAFASKKMLCVINKTRLEPNAKIYKCGSFTVNLEDNGKSELKKTKCSYIYAEFNSDLNRSSELGTAKSYTIKLNSKKYNKTENHKTKLVTSTAKNVPNLFFLSSKIDEKRIARNSRKFKLEMKCRKISSN